MSGTLSVGLFEVTTDSIGLNQIEDVVITSETHNDLVRFNDNATDPTYTDGFVNKSGIQINEVDDINVSSNPTHNSLFTYNDSNFVSSIVDGWIEKSINDILDDFQITVDGLVNIQLSIRRGRQGDPALSDSVAFLDDTTGTGGFTMGIASCGDNNIIFKRGLIDENFKYLQVMSKGEQAAYNFAAGTIFRSTKGITGFSGPFPLPFGLASMSSNYFRFFAFRDDVFVYVTSAGLESIVTLFASDETTIVDGPFTIPPYGSTTLACNANTEFVITSTQNVYCGTSANNGGATNLLDTRIVPPMTNEILTYNRFNRVTAQFTNTTVTWYRRNGDTNSFTVNAGTPVSIYTGNITGGVAPTNAGSTVDYFPDGWLILKADKPISCFSGADGAGSNATPGWPLDQLSQLFANPATVSDSRTRADQASVSISSPFEGTATVYNSSGVEIDTFTLTRGTTPATTSNEQLFPAAGQWQPIDLAVPVDWTGGWVQTNVPAVCVMNFMDSTIHTADNGDETMIPGVTPDEIRAEIVKDAGGLFRRRDISDTGVETWNIC